MEIYIDIIILENCIINFFLLTLTMNCIKHKCRIKSLVISSFIGGIYTIVMFIPKLAIMSCMPCELAVACIMLRLVYGKTGVINMIKLLLLFLMISFTLSGVCFLFSLRENIYLVGNTFKIEKYSVKYIMLGIMIIYIICSRLVECIKDKLFIDNCRFILEFEIEDKQYSLKSFLDTGNELREPITNLPCILIEENFIKDINFEGKNVYFILYSSIGYSGKLKGIRVNDIRIKRKDFLYEKIDAIICPCKEKLSNEDEFSALLSRGVAYKGDIYGKTNSIL